MKKAIDRVVDFPNGCESVPFTACLVSLLMRAQGITEENQPVHCEKKEGHCTLCGECGRGTTPLAAKHNELYNHYPVVSGYGFVQTDLSDDGHMRDRWWDVTSHKLLRAFDDYVAFTLEYAGYDYERLGPPEPETKGLENKTIRNTVADCVEFARQHDEYLLDALKKAF